MASLSDLRNARGKCHDVPISGLSAGMLAFILQEFPTITKIAAGHKATMMEISAAVPGAIPYVIACGCGGYRENDNNGGSVDADMLQSAREIPIETQMDFLEEIAGLTFPKGTVPFIQRLLKMSKSAGVDFGGARSMISPKQSQSLSATETLQPPNVGE